MQFFVYAVPVHDFGPIGSNYPRSTEEFRIAVWAANEQEAEEALFQAVVTSLCHPDEVGEIRLMGTRSRLPANAEQMTPTVFLL
jgi:hypothetical protein